MGAVTLIRPAQPAPATGTALSMWDRVQLGSDGEARRVSLRLGYRNLLVGGLPDTGKSNVLALIVGHAALSSDASLYLFDGKGTELVFWEPLADRVVGYDIADALDAMAELQGLMDLRLSSLCAAGLRKVTPATGHGLVLVVVDELALYTSAYGEPAQQKRFAAGLRDLVARGRAAGVIVVVATQRPSSDIVPTSLRDLIAYRWALACANDASSDVILRDGLSNEGFSAAGIDPADAGVGLLLAETGRVPLRLKADYLDDDDIRQVVATGLALRGRMAEPALTAAESSLTGGETR